MKQLFTFLLFGLFCISVQAQDTYLSLVAKGDAAYDAKSYKESGAFYLDAFKIQKPAPGDAYNAACSFSLIGDKKNAIKCMKKSLAAGWTNHSWMQSDSDLDLLKDLPVWNKFVAGAKSNEEAKISKLSHQNIRLDLLAMQKKDQELRKAWISARDNHGPDSEKANTLRLEAAATDKQNTAEMKDIIAKIGWPTYDAVGKDGANAAWLLVQHADADKDFQRSSLVLLKEAVEKGQASGKNYAYLYDRVAVGSGLMQLYGTQARGTANGGMEFAPIEDEANLDLRRAEMGLNSATDYAKRMNFEYSPLSADEARLKETARKNKYQTLVSQGMQAFKAKDYDTVKENYATALKMNGLAQSSHALDAGTFFAAIAQEQEDFDPNYEQTFRYLEMAVNMGFTYKARFEQHPRLAHLVDDDRFQELMTRCK